MPVTLDDMECDFDAAIAMMVKEAIAELEGKSEEELIAHAVKSSTMDLVRLHMIDAPDFLIKEGFKRQRRALTKMRSFYQAAAAGAGSGTAVKST